MNRRQFLTLATVAALNSVRTNAQNPKWPEPDLQTPSSVRGQEIAKIARSIHIERRIAYVKRPERTLCLNVYHPKGEIPKPLPAILYFGIAAWSNQNINFSYYHLDNLPQAPTPNLYAPVLVPQGFIVVSAECRVASEARFPAQIHDCKCAVKWMRAHAKEFHIDPERIGVMGASASGHLAALVAVTNSKDGLEDDSCYAGYSSRVQAAYCFAGLYDFEFYHSAPGDGTLRPQVIDFLGGTHEEVPYTYRQASPTRYVTADDPPFLLMHGKQDRRVPYEQAVHCEKILKRIGVPVKFISIDNYVHGEMPGKQPVPSCEVMDQEIFSFFQKYLKNRHDS